MLSKLAPLMYLWMIGILMVTHTPRDGVGSRNSAMYIKKYCRSCSSIAVSQGASAFHKHILLLKRKLPVDLVKVWFSIIDIMGHLNQM